VQPTDHSLTSDPSYQAPPLRTFAARHRSCTADCSIPVFRYRFGPSWPGPAQVLPSVRRATLLGFTSTLRRLAPASGERSSLIARAHVPVGRNRSPRFVFVGRSALLMEMGAAIDLIGFWASTPVCGPFLAAIVRLAARSFLPWALPLAGSADTLKCIRTGSTPSGSPNPKGRDAFSSD
jgi:hypothetical protein